MDKFENCIKNTEEGHWNLPFVVTSSMEANRTEFQKVGIWLLLVASLIMLVILFKSGTIAGLMALPKTGWKKAFGFGRKLPSSTSLKNKFSLFAMSDMTMLFVVFVLMAVGTISLFNYGDTWSTPEMNNYTEFQNIGIWMLVAASLLTMLVLGLGMGFVPFIGGFLKMGPMAQFLTIGPLFYCIVFALMVTGTLSLLKDNEPYDCTK